MHFYTEEFEWVKVPPLGFNTNCTVVDNDAFSVAQELFDKYREECVGCLNFASDEEPGGGYKCVMDIRGPIRTQEEDLFRRSDLPKLMDTPHVRTNYYPLQGLNALHCIATVFKDKYLNELKLPFEVGVITMPALIDPQPEDKPQVKAKIRRILEIADDNQHTTLILGAWGCGVFNNDPRFIAESFQAELKEDFFGVFKDVIYAIPGVNSPNHMIFKDVVKI